MATHFSSLQGQVRTAASSVTGQPTGEQTGDLWFDTDHNALLVWNGTGWMGRTMTSTSTSTTSTSTTTTSTTTT